MTATATPPDNPRPGRLLAGLSPRRDPPRRGCCDHAILGSGCSKPPPPPPDTEHRTERRPLGRRRDQTEEEGHRPRCHQERWLTTLTNDVSIQDGQKLPAMSDEAAPPPSRRQPCALSPADREEIRGAAFSAHDGVYLADCFYLRDAARSLTLTGLPPEKQAELAFAWVCRQVYLQPWLRPLGTTGDGVPQVDPVALPTNRCPPSWVRVGIGAHVCLPGGMLQQLRTRRLPDWHTRRQQRALPAQRPWREVSIPPNDGRAALEPAFWAVGVRVGNDVRLFDPWRGQPFPGHAQPAQGEPGCGEGVVRGQGEDLSGATALKRRKEGNRLPGRAGQLPFAANGCVRGRT